jgi:hypothetical protein
MKKIKLEWLKKHRIFYYKPEQEQVNFHASSVHTRLVVGTNRSGKTTCGCVEDISFALGFKPWLCLHLLDEFTLEQLLGEENWRIPQEARTPLKPPCKVLIIEDDWDTADEILVSGKDDRAGKLTYYIPEAALACKPIKNALGYICEYQFRNGSIIRIDTEKSFVNDPNSFEGGTNDVVHYDEGKRRALRVALKRGLVDKYGYEIFTLTPLTEPWIYHEVYKKAATNKDIQTFFLHAEKNPYISKEGWQSFLETLTSDEIAARARGEWVFLKGLVYPEFSHRHVKDGGNVCDPLASEYIASHCTVYFAIDPHPRQPQSVLFLAADDRGRLIVFDEIFKCSYFSELCDLIKTKYSYTVEGKERKIEFREYFVARQIIDPIAFNPDPVTGLVWADEFASCGVIVEEASKQRERGILATRAALAPHSKTGERQLFIASNCIETLREIEMYVYQEWKDTQNRSAKEKPIDRDDHMMENLYRLILLEPQFIDLKDYSKPINVKDLAPIWQ